MSKWVRKNNMSLVLDYYELTMSQVYFNEKKHEDIVYFDLFFRRVPENGGYAIMAGLDEIINALENFHFDAEDIEFLRSTGDFTEEFLDYLTNLNFSCDIWAIPEGTVVFPGEPLLKVRGPLVQAQLIETMLLLNINHQSLIATKASRINHAAEGRAIAEFGARRAQGYDASVLGARAAYIGGVSSTSSTMAGGVFNVPVSGTMAHSFIQLYDNEYDAFVDYAKAYPDNTVLLVDTYNVLKQGIPNAIKVAKEVLEPMGKRLKGIRIDSGDLTYLTQETRKMLDEAGLEDCKIVVSNSLDEYAIKDLYSNGAKIDSFGVGERLITSKSEPVFGGVYKLSGVEKKDGSIRATMKISENVAKITNPGSKEVYRFYDNETGKAIADLITLEGEEVVGQESYELFDPIATWKRQTVTNFTARPLLEKIFENGELKYERPSLNAIKNYCTKEKSTLWPSVMRFDSPHEYYVDLSQDLWDLKQEMIRKLTKNI